MVHFNDALEVINDVLGVKWCILMMSWRSLPPF